jgi:hypothetical protein
VRQRGSGGCQRFIIAGGRRCYFMRHGMRRCRVRALETEQKKSFRKTGSVACMRCLHFPELRKGRIDVVNGDGEWLVRCCRLTHKKDTP